MKEVHSMVLALQRTVEFENELEAHSPSGETGEVTFVGIMSTCFEPYMSKYHEWNTFLVGVVATELDVLLG